jgi:hypothetical protein
MQTQAAPRKWIITCLYAVGLAVGLALLLQHWVHLPAFLPYIVVLACPLMHLFMHGAHSRHRHEANAERTSASPD